MKNMIRTAVALMLFATALAFAQSATNTQVQALPLGRYTALEVDGPTLLNPSWSSVDVIITVTGFSSGQYTPHIQGIDRDGTAYDMLVGAAITANGTTVLHVGTGILALPAVSAQVHLPSRWRVIFAGASSPSMNIVVNANLGL